LTLYTDVKDVGVFPAYRPSRLLQGKLRQNKPRTQL
jgi:hypothetical protein